MNNRKQSNKRGKNPRTEQVQVIKEPETITRRFLGSHKLLPNPRAGTTTRITHRAKSK